MLKVCLSILACLLLIGVPASAEKPEATGGPAQTTIGSDLRPAPTFIGFSCGPGVRSCTILPTKLAGESIRVPSDGVLTKWRLRRGADGGSRDYRVRLRIVNRVGPNEFEFSDLADTEVVTGGAGIKRFSSDLPVQEGDLIALDFLRSNVNSIGAITRSSRMREFFPAPPSGEAITPDHRSRGYEVMFNATVTTE